MSERHLEVVSIGTREVVHRVDVSGRSDNEVTRILCGMLINSDHERYFIRDTADGD